ncbi:hypothetical protein HDU93_006783, partial [Gonapodya sp. JEL0774]
SFKDSDVYALFAERFEGERLVKVLPAGDAPEVKHISGKHHVEIGGFKVSKDGKRVVVCATIDNLLKGAATQAMQVNYNVDGLLFVANFPVDLIIVVFQNINIALGFDELDGILLAPEAEKEHPHGVQEVKASGGI